MIQPDNFRPSNDTATTAEAVSPEEGRARIIEKLEQVIQKTVEPDSWACNGGAIGAIQEFKGVLLIKQTLMAHAQIERLLNEIRRMHSVEVAIESRIMFVTDALYSSLNLPTAAKGAPESQILNDQDLTALLEKTVHDPGTIDVASPRITIFSGQTGYIQRARPEKGLNVRLDVVAAASADRRHVVMGVEPEFSQNGAAKQSLSGTFTMPDGGTLVMGGAAIKLPLANGTTEQRHLLILVRPKIIEERLLRDR